MKIITRNILPFQEKDYFFAIRDKIGFSKLILNSIRTLLLNLDIADTESFCSLKLIINKMSRLFIYKNGKFSSISFPFHVYTEGNEVTRITTYSGLNVDNKTVSLAISVLNDEQFRIKPSTIDYCFQLSNDDMSGLYLLEEIFLTEPAYIRYDKDFEKQNGNLHPLNHLDINYSSYSTYKFGLDYDIAQIDFENYLNILTDCSFLSERRSIR